MNGEEDAKRTNKQTDHGSVSTQSSREITVKQGMFSASST